MNVAEKNCKCSTCGLKKLWNLSKTSFITKETCDKRRPGSLQLSAYFCILYIMQMFISLESFLQMGIYFWIDSGWIWQIDPSN